MINNTLFFKFLIILNPKIKHKEFKTKRND